MTLEIELFGQLLPGEQRCQNINMDAEMHVFEVAKILGLEPDELGLITINGVQSEINDFVHPGSRLCFFPYMSGG